MQFFVHVLQMVEANVCLLTGSMAPVPFVLETNSILLAFFSDVSCTSFRVCSEVDAVCVSQKVFWFISEDKLT